jgi:hypothetical protein
MNFMRVSLEAYFLYIREATAGLIELGYVLRDD